MNTPRCSSSTKTPDCSEPGFSRSYQEGKSQENDKTYLSPDKLTRALMPILKKLYAQKPMDLSAIEKKLNKMEYTDAWEYVNDIRFLFDNAWLYNRKDTYAYKYCTKLSEVFEKTIDPVMQDLGYCCGRKYAFKPQVLYCYRNNCRINGNKSYFLYQDRYIFCQKCFNNTPGDTVTLKDDDSNSSETRTAIKKEQFQKMKNELVLEPFVTCTECDRRVHQICVLYMEASGFTCDNCLKKKGQKREENKFNAKRLPKTKLGTHIETRVNNFLNKENAGAEVVIRVVASSDKETEVKPGMHSRFVKDGHLPDKFPYRSKAILAFEELNGTDVCFFGMYVQEYGNTCSPPNTRRVYIAYLDSVKFFQPNKFRTAVYHEILLGYLDYAKFLGYTMAHIWAFPPSKESHDYIFYRRPHEQKIPTHKKLQEWYIKMLDKGKTDGIVVDYKDILEQTMEDRLSSAAELPYFEGDFWPNKLENYIRELDRIKEKRKAKTARFSQSEENAETLDNKKKGQKKADNLFARMCAIMKKHKNKFFVIRLHEAQSVKSLPPIQDPDPAFECHLMDGPDAFLTKARKMNYEFSDLRRAKFSTMSILYELHLLHERNLTAATKKKLTIED